MFWITVAVVFGIMLAMYGAVLIAESKEKFRRCTEWDDSTQIHEWKVRVRGDR